jgi:hypothetical protein
MANKNPGDELGRAASPLQVIASWAFVGLPLAWGNSTLKKAAQLFQ